MAKKTPLETDLTRLQKKVNEKRAGAETAKYDAKMRALHKRLKRAQRKKRRLAMRKKHAMGKKAAAPKTETTGA